MRVEDGPLVGIKTDPEFEALMFTEGEAARYSRELFRELLGVHRSAAEGAVHKDALVTMLSQLVGGGASIEVAVRNLRMLGTQQTMLEAAKVEYETRVSRIRSLKIPTALEDDNLGPAWYSGPKPDDVFWPALREAMLASGLSRAALESVDGASSKVVGYLAPPGATSIKTRGLVVGHVQSGKTTSFMSVIAKAADVGYRLFIVLSGVHNSLRWQTQDRLNRQLIGPVEKQWFRLTDEADFVSPQGGNVNKLLGDPNNRLIAVVKKNPSRLRRLNRWLDGAALETMQACPILVIDDEADQASVDVGTDEQRSAINKRIIQLLEGSGTGSAVRKAAYVGYTATPFANLLINPATPEDLYPRDFVVDLEQPDGHWGTEVIFGRERLTNEDDDAETDGWDMVRDVPDEEVGGTQPPGRKIDADAWIPSLPPSLREALRWFVMAAAARRTRRTGVPHSTMLIHTTVRADAQEMLRGPVGRYISELRGALERGDVAVETELREHWEAEQARLPSIEMGQQPVSFDAVRMELGAVLGRLTIVVDNYKSQTRLHYPISENIDDPNAKVVVAIGGNTLSRGLTLEGLLSSYFVRSASAYDTLLQMGRWFGFRGGYEDLPRIWMTPYLKDWFTWIATVEYEVRLDIKRYEAENLTPREFAVRIRTHPKMAITSAAKMRSAVEAQVSYSGQRLQTILFNHRDRSWLGGNIAATQALIRDARLGGVQVQPLSGRALLSGIDVNRILDFLDRYSFHPDAYDLRREPLKGYIAAQNKLGDLLRWNVVIMERPARDLGTLDLGLDAPIGLMNRSRMDIAQPHANIKSLMSRVDRVADLAVASSSVTNASDTELQEMRPDGIGLLVIYPIAKHSKPLRKPKADGKQRRKALEAEEDVIGVGLVFPEARGHELTPQSYMTADLSSIEHEVEEFDLDEGEEEDELDAPMNVDGSKSS
jgi:hypothetical protein